MDKIAWLREVVNKNPQDAQGWFWLGQELMREGEAEEALLALSEGLKHSDDALRTQLIAEDCPSIRTLAAHANRAADGRRLANGNGGFTVCP